MTIRSFFGGIITALGWLLLTLTGPCAVVMLVVAPTKNVFLLFSIVGAALVVIGSLIARDREEKSTSFAVMVMVIGGIILVISVLIMIFGRPESYFWLLAFLGAVLVLVGYWLGVVRPKQSSQWKVTDKSETSITFKKDDE